MKWSHNHRLLLVYKDDLAQQKGLLSSARVASSFTIEQHRKCASREHVVIQEKTLFGPLVRWNERHTIKVPRNCCVWGWWRKPWEAHQELFAAIKGATSSTPKPLVLLYNQYLRRLYQATIHDLYFEEGLTSVVVPVVWREHCPEYYRDVPHLCGAFLALEIHREEKDAKDLQKLFVDALSFDTESSRSPTVVPPPEDATAACRSMIDAVPRRSSLRVAETTVLILRPSRQKENTAALLNQPYFPDGDLALALQDTAWLDALEVLSRSSVEAWSRLADCPLSLRELGRKARESDSRVTRLDFELVARAFSSAQLRTVLTSHPGSGEERIGPLGSSLLKWVTTTGEREGRRAAADVFKSAWSVAVERYQIAPLAEKYLDHLPAMEAIASAVRHELGRKFYRDHLSHNVRAALLASRLADEAPDAPPDDVDDSVIAFFSGLLHDIALPVTAFPDTVGSLAQALAAIQSGPATPLVVPGILDKRYLRHSLAYVALIASTPNVATSLLGDILAPWLNPEEVLSRVDRNLLFEELLCAASEEHALTSAALLFDAAVRGREGNEDFDTGVRSLFSRMSGSTAERTGRELACILQSMALHDRKPAVLYHPVHEPPAKTPKPLYWSGFRMPIVVNVADEFQEWGRTVGAIEGLGAIDASISLGAGQVSAKIILSPKAETFASVPFSLLESIFGKIRSIGKIVYDGSDGANPFRLSIESSNLSAFRLSHASVGVATKILFQENHEFLPLGSEVQRSSEVMGEAKSELLRIDIDTPGSIGRDFLLLGGSRDALDVCSALGARRVHIDSLSISADRIEITLSDGTAIAGSIQSYRFGDLRKESAPSKQYPARGAIALLKVNVVSISPSSSILLPQHPQMRPAPHFLDSDWRFTERTARVISDYCHAQATRLNGEICFLGCPTVALWHSHHCPHGPEWQLLDRGHFALRKWLGAEIPLQRFRRFDVFDELEPELRERFAVVIADPPWYEDEYEAFWLQAQALVKPGGIIGITYYPPTLDETKHRHLQEFMRSEYALFGSTEIDYEVPEFESISGLQVRFEHPESGIYRPGYIDFYEAPLSRTLVGPAERSHKENELPEVEMIDDIHFLRYRPELKSEISYPMRVISMRRGIDHLKVVETSIIGWTTRNLVIQKTADAAATEISSFEELMVLVRTRDSDKRIKTS